MRWDCDTRGHLTIGEDTHECLACEQLVSSTDRVTHMDRSRPHDELTDPRSIATDYGPADLNGEHFA